jgi:hypothetical protein
MWHPAFVPFLPAVLEALGSSGVSRQERTVTGLLSYLGHLAEVGSSL